MIALIQRVTQASVSIGERVNGSIDQGLLVLLGVEKDDTAEQVARLAHKVANYRVFEDDAGKMNLSLRDISGQALVVSQFTLAADTRKGMRPSFSSAGAPQPSQQLYQDFVLALQDKGVFVATGEFAADMQVQLINDGPVTFWLQVN